MISKQSRPEWSSVGQTNNTGRYDKRELRDTQWGCFSIVMVRDGCKGADIVENGSIVHQQMIQQSASMG